MCGIAGVVGADPHDTPDPLAPALATLASGPGQAVVRRDGWACAPSNWGPPARARGRVGGRQPFVQASGAISRRQRRGLQPRRAARSELAARGEVFRTRCDGEVLAALLERDGIAGLSRVEGSYAFAFLAGPDGPLLLDRDPAGVRPLAWSRTPRGLAFASTVDALLATGLVIPRADPVAIAQVLRDGVVFKDAVGGRASRASSPATCWRSGRTSRSRSTACRREPPPPSSLPGGDPEGGVLDALRAAVEDRLKVERPLGVFLSGGIDSALVASFARVRGDVTSYTLTFPGHPAADEAKRAARTAARLGLRHVEVPCPADPTPWVLGAARAFDEPFADASAIPTWGSAKFAGAAIRAALLGTGGDEVFGGYRRYWLLGAGPWLRRRARVGPRAAGDRARAGGPARRARSSAPPATPRASTAGSCASRRRPRSRRLPAPCGATSPTNPASRVRPTPPRPWPTTGAGTCPTTSS